MNKFFIIIPVFFLSGCFYQTVNMNDIESAFYICAKEQAQIVDIKSSFEGREWVTCSNRRSYHINREAIK